MGKLHRWPLVLIALPAAVAIWNGWVGLGGMTGFGPVHPLPGIRPGLVVNTAITLPVGLEAYAAYALAAWLGPWRVPARARRFAMWSALGSLGLGMSGQIAFHLLAAWHQRTAPGAVIVLVACVPVIVVGLASGLTHLLRDATGDTEPAKVPLAAPLVAALAARIAPPVAPEPAPPPVAADAIESDTGGDREDDTGSVTVAPPETTGNAPASRQARRRTRAAKAPAWHATARRAVARNPGITAEELRAKCDVSLRSAQRYLQDHPPAASLHAVSVSE